MSIPEAALISAGRLMVSSGSMTASVGRSRQWLIPVFTFIDRDVDLNEMFGAALGLAEPWRVTSVEFDQEAGRLDLGLDFPRGARFRCPSRDAPRRRARCMTRRRRPGGIWTSVSYTH